MNKLVMLSCQQAKKFTPVLSCHLLCIYIYGLVTDDRRMQVQNPNSQRIEGWRGYIEDIYFMGKILQREYFWQGRNKCLRARNILKNKVAGFNSTCGSSSNTITFFCHNKALFELNIFHKEYFAIAYH